MSRIDWREWQLTGTHPSSPSEFGVTWDIETDEWWVFYQSKIIGRKRKLSEAVRLCEEQAQVEARLKAVRLQIQRLEGSLGGNWRRMKSLVRLRDQEERLLAKSLVE